MDAVGDDLPLRSFERFQYDSGTADGFWGELRVGSDHLDFSHLGFNGDADVVTLEPIFAYGGERWEVGARLPFLFVDGRACSSCSKLDESGIGDVQVYGKYVYRAEVIHVGGGVDLSLPSGDDDKGLGAGELGVAPFATAAVPIGPVELRTHLGNLFYTDSTSFRGQDIPADVLLYGGGVFWDIRDRFAVRVEAVGARIDRDEFENVVSLQPGLDVRFPLRAVDLLLRANTAAGLTDSAPDWGVAVGLAVLPTR